jgi:hypothetical protein
MNAKRSKTDTIRVCASTSDAARPHPQHVEHLIPQVTLVIMTTATNNSTHQHLQIQESKSERAIREGFRRRLRTFSPASRYFAKPVMMSPILCARFGWEIKDVDLLVCSNCKGACSVVFPPVLSAESTAKLCGHYQGQLVEAHEPFCLFRTEAEAYFNEIKTLYRKHTLPFAFATVISLQQVQLLENQRPRQVFQDACNTLIQVLQCRLKDNLTLPAVELPTTVEYFQDGRDSTEVALSPTEPLLSRIQAYMTEALEAALPANLVEHAIALTLFGWLAVPDTVENDDEEEEDDDLPHLIVRSECSLCLSQFYLYGRPSDDEDAASHHKRQRTRSPIDAHSYFCPYVCGFGDKQRPLWEILAIRLLQKPAGMAQNVDAVDDAFLAAHAVLRSALSRKFRQPIERGTSAKDN